MPMVPFWSAWFPQEPTFTDKDLPSLKGRVFIVTGAGSGVGLALTKLLYLRGGTIYAACRSQASYQNAIDTILTQTKDAREYGDLKPMIFDLADLRTIKPAVEKFLSEADRLDILFNNAAVMNPAANSVTAQGHDLEIGTNCLGPYLLTQLLEPILIKTAAIPNRPKNSVRVVFVVALIQQASPVELKSDESGVPIKLGSMSNYFQSKAGATWMAKLFADRLVEKNIMSLSVHPGLMVTPLQRTMAGWQNLIWRTLMRKGPEYGAYSEIYGGFADVPEAHNGGHIMAWGRLADLPELTLRGLKSKDEGGNGRAQVFFDYCAREIKDFA